MSKGGPSRADRYNTVVDSLLRQAEDDLALSTAMGRARELESVEQGWALQQLEDDQLALFGWTRTELNIAVDAKKSKTAVPFYLTAANERHITRMRVAQETASGNTGATGYVLPVPPDRKQLPVIEAEMVDGDE